MGYGFEHGYSDDHPDHGPRRRRGQPRDPSPTPGRPAHRAALDRLAQAHHRAGHRRPRPHRRRPGPPRRAPHALERARALRPPDPRAEKGPRARGVRVHRRHRRPLRVGPDGWIQSRHRRPPRPHGPPRDLPPARDGGGDPPLPPLHPPPHPSEAHRQEPARRPDRPHRAARAAAVPHSDALAVLPPRPQRRRGPRHAAKTGERAPRHRPDDQGGLEVPPPGGSPPPRIRSHAVP